MSDDPVFKLIADVARYESALQHVVEEKTNLQLRNDQLEQKVKELRDIVTGFPEDVIIETRKLYDLSKADLFQALLRMVQRCKLESSRITELKARLRLRQNELIQTNNITYQLLELEQANRAQEVFQASLITKIYESRIYKPAVQRQERAIVALENILQALQTQPDSVEDRQASPLYNLLIEDNHRIERLLSGEVVEDQPQPLISPISQQQQQQEHGDKEKHIGTAVDATSNENPERIIERLEVEVAELEEKLRLKAKQQAEETAQLEMQILEAEFNSASDTTSLVSLATSLATNTNTGKGNIDETFG